MKGTGSAIAYTHRIIRNCSSRPSISEDEKGVETTLIIQVEERSRLRCQLIWTIVESVEVAAVGLGEGLLLGYLSITALVETHEMLAFGCATTDAQTAHTNQWLLS